MKIFFGICFLLLGVTVEASQYKDCPTIKDGCAYTYEWDPVCSTLGCTYSNKGHMKCAGGRFWYLGECKTPYTG